MRKHEGNGHHQGDAAEQDNGDVSPNPMSHNSFAWNGQIIPYIDNHGRTLPFVRMALDGSSRWYSFAMFPFAYHQTLSDCTRT
ncbi:hypothetical protein BMS3Bbin04_01876 [bacterium BMS3Bbin04]|nr:hypothetical protein BMS3Bbin04_01876 [bacterium BMS3Bbin04]